MPFDFDDQLLLREVVDALPVLVSYVTADERYGMVNKAYEDWFGLSRQSLLGKTLLEVIGPAAYAVLGPYVKRGLAGETFTFEQSQVPYRLGGKRDVRVSFTSRRTATGAPDGYIALLQDVTALRAAERERDALAAQHAAAQAQKAEFEKQLIGIVSHDLRNPLQAILMGAELLTRSPLPEASVRTVRRMQAAADRSRRMVNDLLDFTQTRLGGGMQMHRQPADLHHIARSVIDEVKTAHPTRTIELKTTVAVAGTWDVDRLGQALQNLLINALTYGAPDQSVEVRATGDEREAELSVRNQGPTIPPERVAQLFEPMTRGEHEVQQGARGVGLGLYIVKQVADAHRGTVRVESGNGATTFTLCLPRDERAT